MNMVTSMEYKNGVLTMRGIIQKREEAGMKKEDIINICQEMLNRLGNGSAFDRGSQSELDLYAQTKELKDINKN